VNIVGRRSMLEHTFHRADKLIAADQIFTVVSRDHLEYPEVRRQLVKRRAETIIVQPANKETGPGILLPLMFVYKQCPEAIVAVFPSDHFILEEDRFMLHVGLAAEAVTHDPARIVLLAIEPAEPEIEYGYIVPQADDSALGRFGTKMISSFIEKPGAERAFELTRAGALWNTMTMVFKLGKFLELVRRVHPVVYRDFYRILEAIGTTDERHTIERVYQTLEPINFSREILERIANRHPEALSVFPVRRVFWSDLGSPERVLRVRNRLRLYKCRRDSTSLVASQILQTGEAIGGRPEF
ncbi:MAG: sugar phosphate nucleotidyltransferase, partial [Pyrinomonadaceae bacterium]